MNQMSEHPAIEDLEALIRLWYNNHANDLGDTIVILESAGIGSYELSIKQVKLMTLDEAIAVMESINEQKH